MERRDRSEDLARRFERVAEDLRTGSATLYGYHVDQDQGRLRGGIEHEGGWLAFAFEDD